MANCSYKTSPPQIVGIRYYNGVAHPGEFVQLVREPRNPYDSNAIRVDNMTGEKVGHIKRAVAAALAPVVDALSSIKIDGTIPSRGSSYTMPCMIDIYGKDASDQVQVQGLLKRHRQRWDMVNLGTGKAAASVVEVSKKAMDWKASQKNLDDMFEQLSKDQLAHLPQIDMPSTLTQTLFDHQVQGIRWLYHRETCDQQVPFYKLIKEGGKSVWFSEITHSSQANAPEPVKGSIL